MLLECIRQASIGWKSIGSKFKPLMGYAQLFIEEILKYSCDCIQCLQLHNLDCLKNHSSVVPGFPNLVSSVKVTGIKEYQFD